MPYASGMDGILIAYLQHARVESHSRPPMPCHVPSVVIPRYGTTRSEATGDLTAALLRDVAHDVHVEPHLQPVTGERFPLRSTITTEQARLDVVVSGLHGGRFERTFLDVRVFNPFAPSNRKPMIAGSYRKHEEEKRRQGRSTRYDWYDHGRTTFRKVWSVWNVQNRNKKIRIHRCIPVCASDFVLFLDSYS